MRKFDSENKGSFRSDGKRNFKKKFKRQEPRGGTQGTVVYLRDGEHPEGLIRRFKKLVELSGVLKELKKREYYLSPAQKKKEKRKRAEKRARKEAKRGVGFSSDKE